MDVSAFREAAANMRSRGFDGSFLGFNHETGEWNTGSGDAKKAHNGRRLALDIYDEAFGWQKFVDRKPVYVDIGFVRDRHQPRPRSELGDTNQIQWRGGQDPWTLSVFLPAYDPETRERFIISLSSLSGKDALAVAKIAWADHNEARDTEQWPLAEITAGDSFFGGGGKRLYPPQLDLVGWIDPPLSFRAVTLPASAAIGPAGKLKLIGSAANGGTGAAAAAAAAAASDLDDEIPF